MKSNKHEQEREETKDVQKKEKIKCTHGGHDVQDPDNIYWRGGLPFCHWLHYAKHYGIR